MTSPFDSPSGGPLEVFAFEALAVAGAAVGFTEATMVPDADTSGKPAYAAFCTVEDGPIRVRTDGTDPTATVGRLFQVGDDLVVWGRRDLRSFRAIRQTGVSATLSTEFARQVA